VPFFSIVYRVQNFWNLRRLRALFSQAESRRSLALNILWLSGLYALLVYSIGIFEIARLAALGTFLSLMFEDLLLLSQHTHIPSNLSRGGTVRPYTTVEQEPFTRSLIFPSWFSRGVLLNMDAHELHHMYPFVPGYCLTRIPYRPRNEIGWRAWITNSKRLSGEQLLFQSRVQSGVNV
jgi:fatty acid desaturase